MTPNEDLIYRIHRKYLMKTESAEIQFDGVSHGTFTVCLAYNKHFENSECQTISDYETAIFNVVTCILPNEKCDPAYFKVYLEKSLVKCIGKN